MSKINIDLKGVQQTLLLPLIGRAIFSEMRNSPIHDPRALEVARSLNYDFKKLLANIGDSTTAWWMARAFHFDKAIKTYIRSHAKAVIVNLGAGLETAFYRVDNGEITWIDLDLPDVIELRKKLLPSPDRVHTIAKSILDFSWIDDLKKFGNEFFFLAGGIFMYFNEEQVKSIFLKIANHFPNSQLIFDNISKNGLKYANDMLKQADMANAILKWGLDDGEELEHWSSHIEVIAKFPFFKDIKTKYSFPLFLRMKMFYADFYDKGGIIHLKFK